MEIKLDTSGYVKVTHDDGQWHRYQWSDLSPFTQGYVEALFSDEQERIWESGGLAVEMDQSWIFRDLAPETLTQIIADCDVREAGWKYANSATRSDDTTEGRRFWRDRQSGVATSFPPLTVQLGDDGKVRFA